MPDRPDVEVLSDRVLIPADPTAEEALRRDPRKVDDYGPTQIDSDAGVQNEVIFSNGACALKLIYRQSNAKIARRSTARYARKILGRTPGYIPTGNDMSLSDYSIEELKAEITRRRRGFNSQDEGNRRKYVKGSGISSVDFFLEVWGDVLGPKKRISKQRVRDHDEYLMSLIESYITNRINAGNDLGKLEGITFLIKEEKSNNRSRKYARRHLTAPVL